MFTREFAIDKAKEFINSCREKNIVFNNVILFGSAVRGDNTDFSDIDLLLVSDSFGFDKWENAKIIAPINKHFSFIDTHTYPTAYYMQGDPLINEIKKTGIEIKMN